MATVYNHGSICLVKPETDEERTWLEENVSEDAMWWAGGLVVEPRYVEPLLAGLAGEDGE